MAMINDLFISYVLGNVKGMGILVMGLDIPQILQ
jgi:hypothetical protein